MTYQDVSGCIRMYQDVAGCSRMYQDVSGCKSRMLYVIQAEAEQREHTVKNFSSLEEKVRKLGNRTQLNRQGRALIVPMYTVYVSHYSVSNFFNLKSRLYFCLKRQL